MAYAADLKSAFYGFESRAGYHFYFKTKEIIAIYHHLGFQFPILRYITV